MRTTLLICIIAGTLRSFASEAPIPENIYVTEIESIGYIFGGETVITNISAPKLHAFVETIAKKMGIEMPTLIYVKGLMNAAAMKLPYMKPRVYLGEALMKRLSTRQFEVVVIHELGHIKHNHSLRAITLALLTPRIAFRPIAIAPELTASFASRYAECEADDEALALCKDPQDFIEALTILKADEDKERASIRERIARDISNSRGVSWLWYKGKEIAQSIDELGLYDSHPSPSKRIKRARKYAA